MFVDGGEHAAAAIETLRGDILRGEEVADGETLVSRIATERERTEGAAHVARALVRDALARDNDVGRKVIAAALFVRDDRTIARELKRRARAVTREHVVRAAFVRRFTVRHRTDDGQLVHDLRDVDELLADVFARDGSLDRRVRTAVIRRGERLRVPRLVLRHAARKVDVDDGVGHRVEGLDAGDRGRLEAKHVREAQAERADHADVHEVAATQSVQNVGVVSFTIAMEFHRSVRGCL